MRYPSDELTDAERARLAPHFTSLDGPVFALVNLPETVKGALFARYSRYPGTLRRLFLDEFADSLPEHAAGYDGEEGKRAAELYERIFVGYGDDSVAQLGGAHVACEWTSNILTKILQRPRLGAYLEQSTRYIAYDAPMPGGGYRYYRDPALGPEYEQAMDCLFDSYAQALPIVRAWVDESFPRAEGESDAARRRAVNAKAYDLLRGLLPAASLSHMGIYATGQAYEQLILHLLGHPLPEARRYGGLILDAIKAVMPSFVARVERPERGGEWIAYLAAPARGGRALGRAARPRPRRQRRGPPVGPPAARRRRRGALLASLLFEAAGVSEERTRAEVAQLSADDRARLLADLVGDRANRRHRPGRGFEALRYRFEIVSDYGAFRDLQRHRMLTVQWQGLTPDLGAGVPDEVVEGRGRRSLRARARALRGGVRAARGGRPARRRPVRALPRLPHPLRARPQRPRGDAHDRAALRPRGPPELPRGRARDARADRRAPPRGRRGDDARRHQHRAPARAHPLRDAHRAARARRPLVPLVRREDSVLVVVDAQPGFFGRRMRPPRRSRGSRGWRAWRRCSTSPPSWSRKGRSATAHRPGILERLPAGTPVIEKPTFGLAAHEAAVDAIRATGRDTAVLVGFETDVCVAQSAIGLLELGFRAVVLEDPPSTRTARREHERGLPADGRHGRRAQPLQGRHVRVAAHGRPRARGLPRRAGARHPALAPLVNGTD